MSRPLAIRDWLFLLLMAALTVLFAALGLWQWQRLAEKEALIATVTSSMKLPPVALPKVAAWRSLDADALNYRPMSVTGRYLPDETVLVFTSLSAAHGMESGPGYWVMTPLAIEGGGSIFVNRGFVPQDQKSAFASGGEIDLEVATLTGIARLSEEGGSFTPATDTANRIDWIRSIDRLARLTDPSLFPFAPVYLDLPAGPPGTLPQGGETVVEFPNNHLGYALTWFGFALITPVLLVFWLVRRRRPETA
jgi:surfeit locus 1 family protein